MCHVSGFEVSCIARVQGAAAKQRRLRDQRVYLTYLPQQRQPLSLQPQPPWLCSAALTVPSAGTPGWQHPSLHTCNRVTHP